MNLPPIHGLIRRCPPWHLLNRAEDLRRIIVYLTSKSASEREVGCGIDLAENLIFSALKAWHDAGSPTEDNRFDLLCLISYLHHRADKSNPESKLWHWQLKEISLMLLFLHAERRREPGTMNCYLINFLEDWADFLLAETHSRRTKATG